MVEFAIRHTVGDNYEILAKFKDKESALAAAKKYREDIHGGNITVFSADFSGDGWKKRSDHRIIAVL